MKDRTNQNREQWRILNQNVAERPSLDGAGLNGTVWNDRMLEALETGYEEACLAEQGLFKPKAAP